MNERRFGCLAGGIFIMSLLILSSAVFARAAVNITVDGKVSDWAEVTVLGSDADDMADNNTDVKAVYAANNNDYLYLRADVYGNIVRSGNYYSIYLDTDQNAGTGFAYGWWTTGADYRIYIDEWTMGLQKFMGSNSSDDTWGWNETGYATKNISMAYSEGVIECAVPRLDIGEIEPLDIVNILFRAFPGEDSMPDYSAAPLTYNYKIGIIPHPQYMAIKNFSLTIDNKWDVVVKTDNKKDLFSAQQLQQALKNKCNMPLSIRDTSNLTGKKHIVLANPLEDGNIQNLCAGRKLIPDGELGEEGYLLEVFKDDMIIISSVSSKGIFYGLQSLKQLLINANGTVKIQGVKIKDWPDSKMRGVHIGGLPGGVEGTKAKLDYIAGLKMNMVVFEEAAYFNLDGDEWKLKRSNRSVLQEIFAYARQRHLEVIPGACSIYRILQLDPHCTEGVWAIDEPFKFVNNVAEPVNSVDVDIKNPGFERDADRDNKPDGWRLDMDNGRVDWSWDSTTAHSGTCSAKISVPGPCNVRSSYLKSEIIAVTPSTGYSISFWAKTRGCGGNGKPTIRVVELDSSNRWILQHNAELNSVDWSKGTLNFVTVSNCAKIYIYANIWDGYGTAWVDDISLKRMNGALVDVIRTESSNIVITNLNKTKTYVEGIDYKVINGEMRCYYNCNHATTRIERIATGEIADRETVLVSYDFGISIPGTPPLSVLICPSEPRANNMMFAALKDIIQSFNPNYIFIYGSSELRGMNRDSRCRKRNMTNSQLMAEDINKWNDYIHQLNPSIRTVMWDDMLNPWHNGGELNPNSWWGKDYQLPYGGLPGDTYLAADLISTNIIPVIWWADPNKMANSPGYFKDKGFDYLVSTYYKEEEVRNWADILHERKDGLGMLNSTWSGAGSLCWNGLIPSADYSWCYEPRGVENGSE